MQQKFRLLIGALGKAAKGPPQNLLEAISTLSPVGKLPSPWTTWLYLALMAYRKRQQWGKDLLREHLPNAIPPCRKFREREQPVEMIMPGVPEWEVLLECGFEFAQLTNRVTGELLMVGLTTEKIEPIIYVDSLNHYVKPQSRWEPAGRLFEIHPDFVAIWHAIDDLVAANVLYAVEHDRTPFPPGVQPDAHHLGIMAAAHAQAVEGFFQRWEEASCHLWLSALIGDWLLAHELAAADGDSQLTAVTKQRADECRAIRLTLARERFTSARHKHGTWDSGAVRMMADLGAEEVPDLIREGLAGNADCVCGVMHFINHDEDSSWCNAVFSALKRHRPRARKTRSSVVLALECGRYLLKHHYRTQDVARVLSRLKSEADEAGLLLLEHAPQHALPAIRRALHGTNSDSNELAAALAMIDRPWSRRELVDALEGEYRDAEQALPLVVALEESHDPETRAVAEAWEQRLDPEMVEGHRRSLRWAMDRLRGRVAELRQQTPIQSNL